MLEPLPASSSACRERLFQMPRYYTFMLGALAVWRITHLLNAEDGPGSLFARLRKLAGSGFWGELLDCFYCLSLWLAIPFAWFLGGGWSEKLLLWPALSGAAILLERATSGGPPAYTEDPQIRGKGEDK